MLTILALSMFAGCPGDIDQSGSVNNDDLFAIVYSWGSCAPGACPADVASPFGLVDVDDLGFVLSRWGACQDGPESSSSVAARFPGDFRIGDATSEGSHMLAASALDYGPGRAHTQLTACAWVRIDEDTADGLSKCIVAKRTRADSDGKTYPFFLRVVQVSPGGDFHQSLTGGNGVQDWHYGVVAPPRPPDIEPGSWNFLSWRIDSQETGLADLFTEDQLYPVHLSTSPAFAMNLSTPLSIGGESGTYAGPSTVNRFIKASIAHVSVYDGLVPDEVVAKLAAGQSPLRTDNRAGPGWSLIDYWSMQDAGHLGLNGLPGNAEGDLALRGDITATDGPPSVERLAIMRLQPAGSDARDAYLSQTAANANFGESAILRVGSGATNSRRRALIDLDLGAQGVPSDAAIVACTLTLHCSAAPAHPKDLEICRMTRSDWAEGSLIDGSGATWNDFDQDGAALGLHPWTSGGGAGGDFTLAGALTFPDGLSLGTGAKTFDITTLAQDAMLNRSGRLNILLKAADEDEGESLPGIATYASSDSAVAEDRPELEITYAAPGKR